MADEYDVPERGDRDDDKKSSSSSDDEGEVAVKKNEKKVQKEPKKSREERDEAAKARALEKRAQLRRKTWKDLDREEQRLIQDWHSRLAADDQKSSLAYNSDIIVQAFFETLYNDDDSEDLEVWPSLPKKVKTIVRNKYDDLTEEISWKSPQVQEIIFALTLTPLIQVNLKGHRVLGFYVSKAADWYVSLCNIYKEGMEMLIVCGAFASTISRYVEIGSSAWANWCTVTVAEKRDAKSKANYRLQPDESYDSIFRSGKRAGAQQEIINGVHVQVLRFSTIVRWLVEQNKLRLRKEMQSRSRSKKQAAQTEEPVLSMNLIDVYRQIGVGLWYGCAGYFGGRLPRRTSEVGIATKNNTYSRREKMSLMQAIVTFGIDVVAEEIRDGLVVVIGADNAQLDEVIATEEELVDESTLDELTTTSGSQRRRVRTVRNQLEDDYNGAQNMFTEAKLRVTLDIFRNSISQYWWVPGDAEVTITIEKWNEIHTELRSDNVYCQNLYCIANEDLAYTKPMIANRERSSIIIPGAPKGKNREADGAWKWFDQKETRMADWMNSSGWNSHVKFFSRIAHTMNQCDPRFSVPATPVDNDFDEDVDFSEAERLRLRERNRNPKQ